MIIAKLSNSTVFLMTLFGYAKNFIIEHRIFQYLNCLKHVVSSDPFLVSSEYAKFGHHRHRIRSVFSLLP